MQKGIHLCIPKQEINKIFEMEEEHYLGLMKFSRKIAKALEKAVSCKRIGMSCNWIRSASCSCTFNSASMKWMICAFNKSSLFLCDFNYFL
jgi:hypothetical protein